MAEAKPAALALTLAQDAVEGFLTIGHHRGFDFDLCKAMTVVSASLTPKPRAVTRLTVTLAMCNAAGALHGGAISTLFDVCTTIPLAIARKEGFWEAAGVTRTLSTTCLFPVFPGEEIEIEGEVVQMGKKLAHILAKMTLVSNGKVVATAAHDKANIDLPLAISCRIPKL